MIIKVVPGIVRQIFDPVVGDYVSQEFIPDGESTFIDESEGSRVLTLDEVPPIAIKHEMPIDLWQPDTIEDIEDSDLIDGFDDFDDDE